MSFVSLDTKLEKTRRKIKILAYTEKVKLVEDKDSYKEIVDDRLDDPRLWTKRWTATFSLS